MSERASRPGLARESYAQPRKAFEVQAGTDYRNCFHLGPESGGWPNCLLTYMSNKIN